MSLPHRTVGTRKFCSRIAGELWSYCFWCLRLGREYGYYDARVNGSLPKYGDRNINPQVL